MDLHSMLNQPEPDAKRKPATSRNEASAASPTPASQKPLHNAGRSAPLPQQRAPPRQHSFPQPPAHSSSATSQTPLPAYPAAPPPLRTSVSSSLAASSALHEHYAQPSPHPSYPISQHTTPLSSHASSSTSRTPPPLLNIHSPYSVRQIHPPYAYPPDHLGQLPDPQYPSQPATPLAPPAWTRNSMHGISADVQSPHYARPVSGISQLHIPSGSPLQHHSAFAAPMQSPSAASRTSAHLRQSSDYTSHAERERSVSVSPKTRLPPRPPSLGSRQSSNQDIPSARSSLATAPPLYANGPDAPLAGHVTHAISPGVAHVAPNIASQSTGSGVAQSASLVAPPILVAEHSLSLDSNQAMHVPQREHQAQKMDMHHLLTPIPPSITDEDASRRDPTTERPNPIQKSAFMEILPTADQEAVAPLPMAAEVRKDREPTEHDPQLNGDGANTVNSASDRKPSSKKRHAESEPAESQPPSKVTRASKPRKYSDRPIWARYSNTNTRCHAQHLGPDGEPRFPLAPLTQSRSQPHSNGASPQPNGTHAMAKLNGHPTPAGAGRSNENGGKAWHHDPPVDEDLARARRILGKWEKTFCWTTPYPDLLRAIQDWLCIQLSPLEDIDSDPRQGTIEIEAKIGKIIRKTASHADESDARIVLPVHNMCLLDAGWCERNIRFESEMDDREHKSMNDFLNRTIRDSMDSGRVPMEYTHPRETDSFRTLSSAGLQALPPAFQARVGAKGHHRELKLRTTTSAKTGEVTARIVKIHIADAHIFNPAGAYDSRISINLEANLLHAGALAPDDWTEEPTPSHPAPADRHKDRLSYRHLAYRIDLTRVDVRGLAPKYELEVEVDSAALRSQLRRMEEGEENAFGDVVAGFLDNATFLMRVRPPKS